MQDGVLGLDHGIAGLARQPRVTKMACHTNTSGQKAGLSRDCSAVVLSWQRTNI